MQIVWIYEHPVDFDGLRRFHLKVHSRAAGTAADPMFAATIRAASVGLIPKERSVAGDIAECARPRAELTDWADERVQLPIDPESGSRLAYGSPSIDRRFDCGQHSGFRTVWLTAWGTLR